MEEASAAAAESLAGTADSLETTTAADGGTEQSEEGANQEPYAAPSDPASESKEPDEVGNDEVPPDSTEEEEPELKRPKKTERAPPSFDFGSLPPSGGPRLLASASSVFKPHYEAGVYPYTRGCRFSPDGLCVLAAASDDVLRIFDQPKTDEKEWSPSVSMKSGETVYDYCWYPKMDSSKPETSCLAVTAQYQPIHLRDAYDGSVRATYRCFNHLDEMTAAYSVAFDPLGTKIYAGLKHEIRIFDVSIPGRDFLESRVLWTKKEGGDQPGIVSCIAPNPYLSSVYALGSYGKTLGVYLEPQGQMLCLLQGQAGGLTHVQFSSDGSRLLAGGRRDSEVLVWDMRNPGSLYAVLKRPVSTNQRVYFDCHPTDRRYVVGGDSSGVVRVWDVCAAPKSSESEGSAPVLDPVWESKDLHPDCVNGASFHPTEPVVATCSGQRRAGSMAFSDEDEEEEEEDGVTWECSLKLWDFSSCQERVVQEESK